MDKSDSHTSAELCRDVPVGIRTSGIPLEFSPFLAYDTREATERNVIALPGRCTSTPSGLEGYEESIPVRLGARKEFGVMFPVMVSVHSVSHV